MVEYHEIAYSVYIVSFFLVTYGAYCEFVDNFYAIKCIPLVNIYMWDGFGPNDLVIFKEIRFIDYFQSKPKSKSSCHL